MEDECLDISLDNDVNELLGGWKKEEELNDERPSTTTIHFNGFTCTRCSREITATTDGPLQSRNVTVENIFPLNENNGNNIRMLYCNSCHLCVAVWVRLRWWNIDKLLTCASKLTSTGPILKEVHTYGERLLLWLLNRIVFNEYENDVEGLVFLPIPERDVAKILWYGGRAIGFYSLKSKFSHFSINDHAFKITDIPIVDLVYVKKEHRGKNFGSVIVNDVVNTFDSDVGFSQPITPPMYKVLKRFLVSYPLHRKRLWECSEGIRSNIWLRLCSDAAREAKQISND